MGRDIKKTIIIDNIAENFEMQPENGIQILSWYNDAKDVELQKLEPILKSVVRQGVSDVRDFIKMSFRKIQPPTSAFKRSPNICYRRGSSGKRAGSV